ncbi:MAG: carbohydrate-binding family 9-like protein, partial [Thermodesulfobacteriota bacterium]
MAATRLPTYPVRRAPPGLSLSPDWEGSAWAPAETLELACFRPEGSPHRPRTRARLLYGDARLFGIFRVEDRYVRSRHTRYGDPVYRDSCVEVFLDPRPGKGYL